MPKGWALVMRSNLLRVNALPLCIGSLRHPYMLHAQWPAQLDALLLFAVVVKLLLTPCLALYKSCSGIDVHLDMCHAAGSINTEIMLLMLLTYTGCTDASQPFICTAQDMLQYLIHPVKKSCMCNDADPTLQPQAAFGVDKLITHRLPNADVACITLLERTA